MFSTYERLPETTSPNHPTQPLLPTSPSPASRSLALSDDLMHRSASSSTTTSSSRPYHQPNANPFASPTDSVAATSREGQSAYSDTVPSHGETATHALYPKEKELKRGSPYGFYQEGPEDDDELHNPHDADTRGTVWTLRGLANLGCLSLIIVVLVALFAGYPIIEAFRAKSVRTNGGFNLGGINATGQIPQANHFALIDPDTPAEALYWESMETGQQWELVFSDEFNREGRSFYEGDDPYWQAVDLHYWGTNNKEWYDPKNVYTRDGYLVLELNDIETRDMPYSGAMIQTWNRFCFTGGYIEAAVSLPGNTLVAGLWPAVWTMGNLGRAGYGGSLDGMWPYTYDSCDYGTFPNQTKDGEPTIALTQGSKYHENVLSYLPGQRLSRCTCPEDTHHPGPKHADGTWVGRAAPEIDLIEAAVDPKHIPNGQVSLSGQWAPFTPNYDIINTTQSTQLYDKTAYYNEYKGAVYQQASSVLAYTDSDCYTNNTGCFSRFGFEYATGDDGYITWLSTGKKTWTIRQSAMGPDVEARIGQRLISVEPMYIIVNLGLSENFGHVDYPGLHKLLPVEMHVDYVRVYQDPAKRNIGCDPDDFPTSAYIESILPAYHDPNITTWDQLADRVPGLVKPKNKELETC